MTEHRRSSDDPAFDSRVRTLLAVAAAPVETADLLPGEDEVLAAFRASPQGPRRISMLSHLVSANAAVASAIGTGVLVTGGVGAAAAGVLPGPAQETASSLLETVGVSVPAGERAEENGDRDGRSEETPAEVPPAADHGTQVSETAKNSTAEGADKGKEIAGVASDGRVEDRGSAGEHDGEPPVSAPDSGRIGATGTASDATDGQEQSTGAAGEGTETADESSDGASSDGSSNGPADD
ncbi:MAG TPA: hypothetical protein VEX15_06655 [Nocardioidaceae bacterium]|nr:hypothetical protein [Nocardioidaceae bacterium]